MKVKKTEQNKPKQPFINFQFPSLRLSCSASLGILSSENTGRTKGMSLLISPVTKSLLNAYCELDTGLSINALHILLHLLFTAVLAVCLEWF